MYVIKKSCIEFLDRKRKKFDWDNGNLSNVELVDEQPRLTDPGVADIPVGGNLSALESGLPEF